MTLSTEIKKMVDDIVKKHLEVLEASLELDAIMADAMSDTAKEDQMAPLTAKWHEGRAAQARKIASYIREKMIGDTTDATD